MNSQAKLPFAERNSIKEIHRAKLRQLRTEIQADIDARKQRAQALRRAEDMEAKWEVYAATVTPLRG